MANRPKRIRAERDVFSGKKDGNHKEPATGVISDAHMCRIHSSCMNPPRDRANEKIELGITRLSTGYWLVRGHGICNWVQVPYWPADEDTIRRCAFDEASEDFLQAVIRRANSWVTPNETI